MMSLVGFGLWIECLLQVRNCSKQDLITFEHSMSRSLLRPMMGTCKMRLDLHRTLKSAQCVALAEVWNWVPFEQSIKQDELQKSFDPEKQNFVLFDKTATLAMVVKAQPSFWSHFAQQAQQQFLLRNFYWDYWPKFDLLPVLASYALAGHALFTWK